MLFGVGHVKVELDMKYCFYHCVYSFRRYLRHCVSGSKFGLMSPPSNISVLRSTV